MISKVRKPSGRILPVRWYEVAPPDSMQRCYQKGTSQGTLVVIATEEQHNNNDIWWSHVSCSFNNHIPGWKYLREVKSIFIGQDRKAIQIFPPESEYVNCHPYVLHLWSSFEVDLLPDFRTGGMI